MTRATTDASSAIARASAFCERFGIDVPICEAPMAGATPVARAIAIARAGGMAGTGVVLNPPDEIASWVAAFRDGAGEAPLHINIWIPGVPPARDPAHERAIRDFLGRWGPEVAADAGDAAPPDFDAQCDAIIAARPAVVSSIMGLFAPAFVDRLKIAGIAWFATVTTLAEALAAEATGADAVIAQGVEGGGHRGTFDPMAGRITGIGLMALVPQLADRLSVPVIAAGGIADGRGIAAALTLGASAVQIGTALLSARESDTPRAWVDRMATMAPEDAVLTRAFSGRPGRAIATAFVVAQGMPDPAPYPVQRGLTAAMRADSVRRGDVEAMQAWAGQAAALAKMAATTDLVETWWRDARALLP